jgi:hypothetical protein
MAVCRDCVLACGPEDFLLGSGNGEWAIRRAGIARWLPAQHHSGENIGETDTHTFFVELKDAAPPSGDEVADLWGPTDS